MWKTVVCIPIGWNEKTNPQGTSERIGRQTTRIGIVAIEKIVRAEGAGCIVLELMKNDIKRYLCEKIPLL